MVFTLLQETLTRPRRENIFDHVYTISAVTPSQPFGQFNHFSVLLSPINNTLRCRAGPSRNTVATLPETALEKTKGMVYSDTMGLSWTLKTFPGTVLDFIWFSNRNVTVENCGAKVGVEMHLSSNNTCIHISHASIFTKIFGLSSAQAVIPGIMSLPKKSLVISLITLTCYWIL